MSIISAIIRVSRHTAFFSLFISSYIHYGCCNCSKDIGKNNNYENKYDAALKVEMSKESSYNGKIACLIELDKEPDSNIRQKLEETGLKINTIAGSIVSCEGKKEAFRNAASFDFVKRIELSRKLFKQD